MGGCAGEERGRAAVVQVSVVVCFSFQLMRFIRASAVSTWTCASFRVSLTDRCLFVCRLCRMLAANVDGYIDTLVHPPEPADRIPVPLNMNLMNPLAARTQQ